MQRYPVAVNSLKSAINYKPHHLEAWNNLGLLYQNLSNEYHIFEILFNHNVNFK